MQPAIALVETPPALGVDLFKVIAARECVKDRSRVGAVLASAEHEERKARANMRRLADMIGALEKLAASKASPLERFALNSVLAEAREVHGEAIEIFADKSETLDLVRREAAAMGFVRGAF